MPKAPLGDCRSGTPMTMLAMDILEPLPLSEQRNRHVLFVMNYLSRLTEAYPIPTFFCGDCGDYFGEPVFLSVWLFAGAPF